MACEFWQDKLTLKTYVQGAEDPHPCFDRPIYPYNMQDDLTHEPQDIEYVALHLENEFLHVIVLPELGGKVFSAYDKIAGREVFYRNNVVKPAMVALRGAWVSGGIEFNFFQRGHSATTMAPVSWEADSWSETGDGRASITVSNVDLRSRARWAITISLRPGDPRLHQRVWLRNRMPYKQRYYFWANAALAATDDLHLVYPAHKARFSREGIVDYPMWRGRDLSLYRNHPVANDIFTLDVVEDFFGCYYPESDAGLVHLADHAESVGKKFFTWGTADEGMIWVDLLTDADGQYVELQSGRFVDQNVYEYMRPFEMMEWDEVWWPIHGMGEWTWASDEAVLRFQPNEEGARIGAVTWRAHPEAQIAVVDGERVLWSARASLGPESPFTTNAEFETAGGAGELVVTITADDCELLRYVHPPAHTLAPSVLTTGERDRGEPTAEDDCTASELYLRGVQHDLNDRRAEARRLYERALQRDSALVRAHVGLGLLQYQAGEYGGALDRFRRAADLDEHHYEARYYLALAYIALGEGEEAAPILRRLKALGRQAGEAAELLWRTPAATAAEAYLERIAQPHLLRDEAEQWLEAASEYVALGERKRAIALLERGCESCDAVAESPMAHYWLAYLLAENGEQAAGEAQYEQARNCDPEYCFPWRLEDIPVLEAAIERDEDDWQARYLLGNLLAGRGRTDEALELWLAAAELNGAYAVLLRNIGWGRWRWRSDFEEATHWYRRAIDQRPGEYRLYVELDRLMADAEWEPDRRIELLRSAPAAMQEKWQLAARKIDALVAAEEWDDAIEQLEQHRFIPWEGARGMRTLWVEALMGRAADRAESGEYEAALGDCERALQYPRNIGVGRRARPTGEARILRRAGEIADKLGDIAARDDYLAKAEDVAADD